MRPRRDDLAAPSRVVLRQHEHGRGELGQRLGERVDGVGQLLDLRRASARRRVTKPSPTRCASSSVCRAANRVVERRSRGRGPSARGSARTPSKPTRAPSTLAWKSHRSVRDQYSSSPVTLPVATSSSRPREPLAIWSTVKVEVLDPLVEGRRCWSAGRRRTSPAPPASAACSPRRAAGHRSFSIRCQPVHFWPGSRSASRASIFGSRSPNDSATVSIRSQWTRAVGVERAGRVVVAGLVRRRRTPASWPAAGRSGPGRTRRSWRWPASTSCLVVRARTAGVLAGLGDREVGADAVADHARLAGGEVRPGRAR